LAICREIGDRWGEGNILGALGTTYGSLENYAKAIDYLKQALAIMQEMGDRKGEGMALGNLGDVYNSLNDYAKAYHSDFYTFTAACRFSWTISGIAGIGSNSRVAEGRSSATE
jgi:hypothetical protein